MKIKIFTKNNDRIGGPCKPEITLISLLFNDNSLKDSNLEIPFISLILLSNIFR